MFENATLLKKHYSLSQTSAPMCSIRSLILKLVTSLLMESSFAHSRIFHFIWGFIMRTAFIKTATSSPRFQFLAFYWGIWPLFCLLLWKGIDWQQIVIYSTRDSRKSSWDSFSSRLLRLRRYFLLLYHGAVQYLQFHIRFSLMMCEFWSASRSDLDKSEIFFIRSSSGRY